MIRRTLAAAALALAGWPAAAADVAGNIAAVKAVGREGAGNEAAAAAWKELAAAGPDALLPLLTAFDDATPAAANWLRSAVDALAEGEKKAGKKLPVAKLEAFAADAKRSPTARRLAFELLTTDSPESKAKLLPGMVNDPSLELRRDAIAAEIEKLAPISAATTLEKAYAKLFAAARDVDQVKELAGLLEKVGAKTPDLPAHFGFVTRWHVAGPFDSTDGVGFAKAYPPEEKFDPAASFTGKAGEKFGWKPLATGDAFGMFDLNKGLGKHKNAVIYAAAVVDTPAETPVEFRVGSQNAVQMFVNGKKVFEREEYHHGTRMDQHVGRGVLKAGKNELLVKVCQNNMTESWAQVFGFQFRVCDATGGAVPLTVVSPTAAEAPTPPPAAPTKESK